MNLSADLDSEMGIKCLWTGLVIIMAVKGYIPQAQIVGSIFMVIGAVLMWLDK